MLKSLLVFAFLANASVAHADFDFQVKVDDFAQKTYWSFQGASTDQTWTLRFGTLQATGQPYENEAITVRLVPDQRGDLICNMLVGDTDLEWFTVHADGGREPTRTTPFRVLNYSDSTFEFTSALPEALEFLTAMKTGASLRMRFMDGCKNERVAEFSLKGIAERFAKPSN